ncbi:MAG: hypothetical protein IKX20_08915 [Paludibacteraceae bacterium]|nr:hypothetical protein [Paludibacteraceae bacterium]
MIDTVRESIAQEKQERREQRLMGFARRHRSFLLTILRDILWSLDGWKTSELRSFITDFNPDVVWLDGSPLILMNRLNNYVTSIAKKPSCTYLMDDVYTYKSCPSLLSKLYRFFLRKLVRTTVQNASHVFVASEKMKEEYDRFFSINSTFLAKGASAPLDTVESKEITNPIKFVYLGNVLIGRLDSLALLARAIHRINSAHEKRFELWIYTSDFISKTDYKKLVLDETIHLCGPVPYNEVNTIMQDNDVVVFVEGLNNRYCRIARLSFSTKIVDYISSGKCIFTIGPADSAPVEYLKEHNISIVAHNESDIEDRLSRITIPQLKEYMNRSRCFALSNHNKDAIQSRLYQKLKDVSLSQN